MQDTDSDTVSEVYGGPLDEDPRTTGATIRYLLPYPLASLYHLLLVQHRPSLRYGHALRLMDGVVRFLALVTLADALGHQTDAKKVEKWLSMIRRPSMGKLDGLMRSNIALLDKAGGPFVAELTGLLDDQWNSAFETIRRARNEYAHHDYAKPDRQAEVDFKALKPALRHILRRIQFLRHYRLGTAHTPRTAGSGIYLNYWRGCRGQEEESAFTPLKASLMFPEDTVMLLDVRRDQGLIVSPFFHRMSEMERGYMAWFDGYSNGLAHYAHPLLKWKKQRKLSDPNDPLSAGVSIDQWRARALAWHKPLVLGLDDASRKHLCDLNQPTDLGADFKVVGRLGEGAMGTVWEVKSVHMRHSTALKVLKSTHLKSENQIRRLRREADLLRQWSHPGIVRVHSFGFDDKRHPWVEMELLDGETLAQRMKREGPLSVGAMEVLLNEVLDALQFVHARGVLHRDIKPSNIMLTQDGAKLIDFGIAKVADGTQLTDTMSAMGTATYMAPEQWNGETTEQSDVFAVGRLIYAGLTGKHPPISASLSAEMIPIDAERLLPIYQRATADDPGERFKSAADMKDALSAVAETTNSMNSSSESSQVVEPMVATVRLDDGDLPPPHQTQEEGTPSKVSTSTASLLRNMVKDGRAVMAVVWTWGVVVLLGGTVAVYDAVYDGGLKEFWARYNDDYLIVADTAPVGINLELAETSALDAHLEESLGVEVFWRPVSSWKEDWSPGDIEEALEVLKGPRQLSMNTLLETGEVDAVVLSLEASMRRADTRYAQFVGAFGFQNAVLVVREGLMPEPKTPEDLFGKKWCYEGGYQSSLYYLTRAYFRDVVGIDPDAELSTGGSTQPLRSLSVGECDFAVVSRVLFAQSKWAKGMRILAPVGRVPTQLMFAGTFEGKERAAKFQSALNSYSPPEEMKPGGRVLRGDFFGSFEDFDLSKYRAMVNREKGYSASAEANGPINFDLIPVRLLFRGPYGDHPVADLIFRMENEDDGSLVRGTAIFRDRLTPGVWTILAMAPGFNDFNDRFTVSEGQPVDREFVLTPKFSPAQVRDEPSGNARTPL